jgi:hypothetical protein
MESFGTGASPSPQTPEELAEERRKLRRLQWIMSLVTATISQDHTITVEGAAGIIADAKRAALAMFPTKNSHTDSSMNLGYGG